MDGLTFILPAGAILLILCLVYFWRSQKNGRGMPGAGLLREEDPGRKAEEIRRDEGEKEEAGQKLPGSRFLYIPSEMLADTRNEDIRGHAEEAVRGFQWEEEGRREAFLYTFTKENVGWTCPFCEGENKEESPICMICGRRRDSLRGEKNVL